MDNVLQTTVPARLIIAAQSCAAKTQKQRPSLQGIFFAMDGSVCGTDGHIAVIGKHEKESPEKGSYFGADTDAVVLIDGAIPQTAETVTFDVDSKICKTNTGRVFSFRFLDRPHGYPNIHRVVAKPAAEALPGGIHFNPHLLAVTAKAINATGKGTRGVTMYTGLEFLSMYLQADVDGCALQFAVMPMRKK